MRRISTKMAMGAILFVSTVITSDLLYGQSPEEESWSPISFTASAVPNSDQLVDTGIGIAVRYGFGITGIHYSDMNQASRIETDINTKTNLSNEKILNALIWKLPEHKYSFGIFHYSLGFGYQHLKSKDSISSVYSTVGGRLFTDEKRTSTFHQPYILGAIGIPLFSRENWFNVRTRFVPYMVQNRKTELIKSSEVENYENTGQDKGLQIDATADIYLKTSYVSFDLFYKFHRRVFMTTIDNAGSSGRAFENVTSQDTVHEFGMQMGLLFFGSDSSQTHPAAYLSYYIKDSLYLAELPQNDQTIYDKGWRFGLIFTMGEIE